MYSRALHIVHDEESPNMKNGTISAVLEACRRSRHISGPIRMTTDAETSVRGSAHNQRTNVNKSEISCRRSHDEGHFFRLLQLDHSLKKNQFFHGLSTLCERAKNTDARCQLSHAPSVRLNGRSSTHGCSRHSPERVNFSILPTEEYVYVYLLTDIVTP